MHLLYVTDQRIDAYLVRALREAGHVVEVTAEPADGVEMAGGGNYEAIVMDWAAPDARCAARFAAAASGALLVVIAATGEEAQRVAVLNDGADACFVRPISFIELETRLEAMARLVQRARPAGDAASVELLSAERAVRINGRSVGLSGREFQLLEHLVGHAGEVIGLERLQQHVWGEASEPRPELVRTCVSRLRRKLEAAHAGALLQAVAGHGYVFRQPAAVGEEPCAARA
ncbi:MAG: response regulator transcription factor [Caulobacteraceae bacterium]|nr:response regulator transcription factor [Caulobacteraceae bacterium]